jgi:hypothetical protein
VLRKIRDIVKAGAVVIGERPVATPSLVDDPVEFEAIVNELWVNGKNENILGKGKILAGQTLQNALNTLGIKPDFSYAKTDDSTNLLFVHRKLGGTDFYWVNNRNPKVENLETTFRITGKAAEIWHPETGKIEQASFAIENGVTKVPLHLEASDAVFVVFSEKTKEITGEVVRPQEQHLAVIEGPWSVSFQENRGAPAKVNFETLIPWNTSTDPGIKYFSGTGTYSRSFEADARWFEDGKLLWLDLGSVKNLAEVIINGKSLGIVWKTPFRVNVTGSLKQGENNLEIKVTNLWVNRLIGDSQPGTTKKITYTTMPFYRADSPLKPSGLLGPVQIVRL